MWNRGLSLHGPSKDCRDACPNATQNRDGIYDYESYITRRYTEMERREKKVIDFLFHHASWLIQIIFQCRNFPSSTNIARRQAAQKEKLDRGEVLYEPKKRLERSIVLIFFLINYFHLINNQFNLSNVWTEGKKKQREQTRNDKGKRPDESKNITSCKAMPNLGKFSLLMFPIQHSVSHSRIDWWLTLKKWFLNSTV